MAQSPAAPDPAAADAAAAPAGAAAGQPGYQVVARRYRPQRFDELVGQEHVARGLSGAIESGRIGHAYLFTGARGVGKTSAARIYAKALECTSGTGAEPCNQCERCRSISAGQDIDVVEIDAASNRGIDEIRQLRQNVAVRPARGRSKIYIIDEVHMLTREAFNALLKTLEEPPAHVKFVLCTTEPEKLPITILSRCQRFDFQTVDAPAIARRLEQIVAAEGARVTPEALALIARRAAGSMRDSQSLLEQLLGAASGPIGVDDVHAIIGTGREEKVGAIVAAVAARDARACVAAFDEALAGGADPGGVLEQLLAALRDALLASVGCGPEQMRQGAGLGVDLAAFGRETGTTTLLAMLQIIDQALGRMRSSGHAVVLAEMAIVRLASLEDLDSLAEAVDKVAMAAAHPSGGRTGPLAGGQPGSQPGGQPRSGMPSGPAASSAVPREKKTTDLTATHAAPDGGGPPESAPSTVSVTVQHSAAGVAADVAAAGVAADVAAAGVAADVAAAGVASGLAAAGVSAGLATAGVAAVGLGEAAGHASLPAASIATVPEPEAAAVPAPPPAVSEPEAAADPLGLWQRASETLGGLSADFAALASRGCWRDDLLEIALPASAGAAASFLRRPEVAADVARALAAIAGRPVRHGIVIDETAGGMQAANGPASPAERGRSAVSQAALVREAVEHPLVVHARSVFDAAVRKVEPPRPRPAAAATRSAATAVDGAARGAGDDEDGGDRSAEADADDEAAVAEDGYGGGDG